MRKPSSFFLLPFTFSVRERPRSGFTLMELMVVVGIMAFLGLAATNGYNALQRGVAERGAVDAASALLKAAKERAIVDRMPTAVFCYNRMIREASDIDNAVIVGEAVAIRRAGRITKVAGQFLYDEFGDLDRSYNTTDDKGELSDGNGKGMRLWRFDDKMMSEMQYSIVAPEVYEDKDIGGCISFAPWGDQIDGGGMSSSNIQIRACAFYDLGTSGHKPPSWQVGNGYGFEFQTLRLPEGFVFGSAVPSQVGQVQQVAAFTFFGSSGGDRSVDIYSCKTDASGMPRPHHKAGTASSAREAAR